MSADPLRIHIHGAGKIGQCFATGLRRAGWAVTLRAARTGVPEHIDADVVLLAVRDGQLAQEARGWTRVVPSRAVVLHAAGSLLPDAIGVLRRSCRGVGQLHPLVSVVSHGTSSALASFVGAPALVAGDRAAVPIARKIAVALGMKPMRGDGWDRTLYHAAAGLVAGGAAALCGAATDMLVQAGVALPQAEKMMASLLGSVAGNVSRVGLPWALSGVIRRGDVTTLRAHVDAWSRAAPQHVELFAASARTQIAMVRRLGEISNDVMREEEAMVADVRS